MTGKSVSDQKLIVAKNRDKSFHSAKNFEQSASQLGQIEPLTSSDKDKARRVVAEQVLRQTPDATAADVIEVLMMLGLHTSQPDWDDGPVVEPSRSFNSTTSILDIT